MNTKIQKVFQIILGFSFIGGFIYGAWLLINAFFDAVKLASPEVVAAIIGAMATVFVGVSAVLISQAHERKRASDEAHRLKKVEIYQGLIDIFSKMIGSSNKVLKLEKPDMEEVARYLFKFKSDILLWGSPKVIKAEIEFEKFTDNTDPTKILKSANDLYLAIREDIGLSNSGLNDLELVKLYLNDEARKSLK